VAIANGIVAKDEMPPCPIDDAGRFTKEVPDFVGLHVKVSARELKRRGVIRWRTND
jgi:isoleucyl-tRNA synthetase